MIILYVVSRHICTCSTLYIGLIVIYNGDKTVKKLWITQKSTKHKKIKRRSRAAEVSFSSEIGQFPTKMTDTVGSDTLG